MKRFVVIVLDGFGIGYMKDAEKVRPEDVGANTCKHILQEKPSLKLPNLEALGLMNALGEPVGAMKLSNTAVFGRAELQHFGADTFYGHQEIMGTKPRMPEKEPFYKACDRIYPELIKKGYQVEVIEGEVGKYLKVNNALTIADNLEADSGQAYNITSALDFIDFQEVVEIGKVVRSVSYVSRVIVFGGKGITIEDIIGAQEEKDNGFIGVNAPKSGVYNKGYQVVHLGYGIDPEVQVPTIMGKVGKSVTLIGKVQDIVSNEYGKSIPGVDTEEVLKATIEELKNLEEGFICTNVQETDLRGHGEDVEGYAEKLTIADKYIGEILQLITKDDILLVMADHGNDPTIGHSHHTREMVPLLIYSKDFKPQSIGTRKTLSDVGASVADFFGVDMPENGESFLDTLNR
ncbi:phosphopentomutase [Alloiococcus sp. CFN-8]|uniref:phosphopentomutase n=1 Tax=Alloiococcus sp. CFN-8 TaxID=3416081 RepID=UPI003CF79A75